ncbi:MAG: DNA polymerase III subunit alpha [Ignavibacterium album]|uniref:DNA polymerase III subunit alpha n=1 Tax=Ignavibacterium album TaxID=591197 RepID=UPI0026EE4FE2|nr:DNA polymerase III subunit alpha [Ignavibacterium album]MCX8105126.1 DNA polymerase III subunit alpha [Ignavibacterium album]
MSDFIHLHNHTHFSLQDGACTVDDLVLAAKKHGMKSVALTDHGVLYGVTQFYKKAVKEGIKPIIGMEAYIVREGSRFDRGKVEDANGKKKSKHYNHLILLAKNETGYKNLVKLSTIGHTEGFYYKPRIDLEVLKQYKDGLICTSACAGGVVSTHLVNGEYDKAREVAKTYKEIFGDDFYLEIQDHDMEIDKPILENMPKLAKELGIKLVATNDCHYIEKDHAIPHNILLLLSDKNGNDYTQLRYGTDQVYFKSAEEMKKLFRKYKDAIESTLEIDEKINLKLDFSKHYFPNFPIPSDSPAKNLDEYFEHLAKEGLYKKIKKVTKEIEDRFNYEVETIKQMGFSGYFLVVQDFINAAKKNNIPVGPGRGSAAGSLVAYALGITNINPLDYNLLFERFLNPSRKSMPDIDVDFADDKRGEVIEYVKNKYGNNCVSQIVTFNTLSSKAVIRDVARVLKIPIPTVNKITKYIPSKFGKVYSIDQALAEVPELKWVKESDDEQIQNLIKYAKVLEGMNRNASKHAAGVVITPDDVSNYVPLATATSQEEIVTQFNMKDIESVGLLKMDFLGLRTLTIIRDALEMIKRNHKVEIDIDNIPLDDEKTYQLFWKGQTTGVFQFESAPMREYLKRLKPTSLNDLAAMNALYRPGPMEFIDDFIDRKFGRKEVKYDHPVLEPILKETYGVIVYQEQVIQIANRVAGMSLAEADILRRAMGKKDLQAMEEQKVKFIEGAIKNKIDKKIAEQIFDNIFKFANYGFNKSHAVAYSLVAYQTAYLKAHYPAEFLAANLKNEFGDTDKVTKFLEDCRKLKIPVLPPDVNRPSVFFDVVDEKIVFGMAAIKNVGIPAVKEIINAKEKLGRNFKSIFDFCINVDTRIVNKRALEGLILAGAFDTLHKNRAQLFNNVEMILEFAHKYQNSKLLTTDSLFGGIEEIQISEPKLPDEKPWTDKEQLSLERKVVGFYITDHPLRKYETEFNSFATIHLGETENLETIDSVRACGVITELKTKIDKSGNNMAFFKLDDFTGSCECIMFSKTFDEYGKYVREDEPVLAIGNLESSGDAIKIHINKIIPMEKVSDELTESVRIIIDKEKVQPENLAKLKNVFQKNEGSVPVFISFAENGTKGKLFAIDNYRVKVNESLIKEITNLLGEDSISLKSK